MKTNIKNVIQNIMNKDKKDFINKKEPHDKTNPPSETPKNNNEMILLVEKKMSFFQDIIQKTILYVQKNKILNILSVSDVNNCLNTPSSLKKQLHEFLHSL